VCVCVCVCVCKVDNGEKYQVYSPLMPISRSA
jgi:hypothetical protein